MGKRWCVLIWCACSFGGEEQAAALSIDRTHRNPGLRSRSGGGYGRGNFPTKEDQYWSVDEQAAWEQRNGLHWRVDARPGTARREKKVPMAWRNEERKTEGTSSFEKATIRTLGYGISIANLGRFSTGNERADHSRTRRVVVDEKEHGGGGLGSGFPDHYGRGQALRDGKRWELARKIPSALRELRKSIEAGRRGAESPPQHCPEEKSMPELREEQPTMPLSSVNLITRARVTDPQYGDFGTKRKAGNYKAATAAGFSKERDLGPVLDHKHMQGETASAKVQELDLSERAGDGKENPRSVVAMTAERELGSGDDGVCGDSSFHPEDIYNRIIMN